MHPWWHTFPTHFQGFVFPAFFLSAQEKRRLFLFSSHTKARFPPFFLSKYFYARHSSRFFIQDSFFEVSINPSVRQRPLMAGQRKILAFFLFFRYFLSVFVLLSLFRALAVKAFNGFPWINRLLSPHGRSRNSSSKRERKIIYTEIDRHFSSVLRLGLDIWTHAKSPLFFPHGRMLLWFVGICHCAKQVVNDINPSLPPKRL